MALTAINRTIRIQDEAVAAVHALAAGFPTEPSAA